MENGLAPFNQYYTNDFGLIDFMDEANFDQFVDLIRGDTNFQSDDHIIQPIFNFYNQDYQYHDHDHDLTNVAAVSNDSCHLLPPPPAGLFDFDVAAAALEVAAANNDNDDDDDDGLLLNACLEDDLLIMDEEESSGSGAAAATTGKKSDRSRTLVSERRRRGRMKEKLYALRSLVPNITKMDKASIVGDAVLYMQDLQKQANRMRAEIAGLESSFANKTTQNSNKSNKKSCFYPTTKTIFKMDVSEVEERRGFYVRVVSNRANGVAALLYRALESLTSFNVRNSNLAASHDHKYVFTFTLHTMEGEMDVNLQSVKVWIATVFLNQGFEFHTSQ